MLGAMIGDITGSLREFEPCKPRSKDYLKALPEKGFFTDDTVMTVAVGRVTERWLALSAAERTPGRYHEDLTTEMRAFGRLYPDMSYGGRFANWLETDDPKPYNSLGNGSAMRVSMISRLASSAEECETLARWSAEVTHNHPEGVKGAVCAALLGYHARTGKDKAALRELAAGFYPELADPAFTVAWLYDTYEFNERCRDTVPQAIECFLEAESLEETVVNCVYIGGDCDTTGAIAGGIAEAFFGIPDALKKRAAEMLFRQDDVGELTAALRDWYDVKAAG